MIRLLALKLLSDINHRRPNKHFNCNTSSFLNF
jgi:hypothetical protein